MPSFEMIQSPQKILFHFLNSLENSTDIDTLRMNDGPARPINMFLILN